MSRRSGDSADRARRPPRTPGVSARARSEGFKRDGELARGPGVLDMKGGLVVVAWALKALAQSRSLPPLRLVIVADEEVGSPEGPGASSRARPPACARGALVSSRQVARTTSSSRAEKARGRSRSPRTARAAHAGNAHKRSASNALWALAKLVDRVQGRSQPTTAARNHRERRQIHERHEQEHGAGSAPSALVDFRFRDARRRRGARRRRSRPPPRNALRRCRGRGSTSQVASRACRSSAPTTASRS